ncbi:poly(A) polymerase [Strigomonas culicis]|uniref:polynucleotide adenylyltransferase n=1 Tax=Strigomonas culicis TaxID=28005 RepID=S9VMS7_9TRYP|nr:poly(A) polymerase [Strigomonas culicis]|eukprot:EPY28486.1 poly(A) polymerase [Strigomonas culicis]
MEIENCVKVPIQTYRTVLRAIKKWARERYVYGNTFSYPNGVCLAIMVARLCLVDFKLSSSKLFRLFFTFYRQWLARKDNIQPIYITANINPRNVNLAGMLPCWEQSKRREDLLPIINPAYPYVNAAHTVGRCSLHFFTEEVNRVCCILDECKLDTPYGVVWERYNPLGVFNCFLAVHVACRAPSDIQLATMFRSKKGYVESKLRFLIYALETTMTVRPISDRLALPQGPSVLPSKECVFLFGLRDFANEDRSFLPKHSYFTSYFNYLLEAVHHDMPADCLSSFDVPLFYTVHAPSDSYLTSLLR